MRKIRPFVLTFIGFLVQLNFLSAQFGDVDSLERVLAGGSLQPKEKVPVLLKLSDLYLSRNHTVAFSYASQAVSISKNLGDNSLLGFSYRSLGNCYSYSGNYDSTVFFLNLALKYNPEDVTALYYLGQNEWYNGTEDNCILYYAKAEKICLKKNDLKNLAIVYYSLADYYRYTQRDSLSDYYVSISIMILEKSNLYGDLATAYNIKAEMYRTRGEYKMALETYIKTAKLAYQVLDSTRIGYCFSRMGNIYYMQNDFVLAEKFLIRSLDIAEKVKGRNLELFCLKTLTDMFSNMRNTEKCLYYANLCIQVGREMKEESAISLAYSSLSTLYYGMGLVDSARSYADKSYKLAIENNDPINMLNSILNIIPIEFDAGNYTKVVQLTGEGIELAKFTETMEHLRDLYKFQYRAYEKLGDKTASFEAFDQYRMYEDSLSNDNVQLGMKESELEMNYQDKHLADTLVYIENSQKARQEILLQKQRSKYTLAIGVIVAILLSIIIFIIWSTSRKRKKLNLSLSESNHDKELLLKEIHHRVKNSLQVVSSLLNLQKTQTNKKKFDELIDESQIKIANIAIVHELLYQSSSFKKINLKQYIDKLGEHVLKTLGDPNKHITITNVTGDVEISLEKSVPLALVVNEIITNSVKYAFNEKKEGNIRIECRKNQETIEVRIADNGSGMAKEQLNNEQGIGMTLIQGFVKQLKGELTYGNENGCFFVFSFPDTN